MSVTWTIRRADGMERTLEEWGISGFTRTLQNLAEDYCTCTMAAKALQGSLPFGARESVTVFRNGVRWFAGIVDYDLPSADGRSKAAEFRINGPLWWLEALIYRQMWTYAKWPLEFTGTLPHPAPDAGQPWDTTGLTGSQLDEQLTVLRDVDNYKKVKRLSSVCILGQDDAGEFIDTAASIRQVLDYAISQGAPFQIGAIPPGIRMPYDQIRDMTCLQVIRRLVQWTPDQGTWVDYTTSPPTVHFSSIETRAVHRIAVGEGGSIESIGLRARHDLQVSGVTINYLRTSTRAGLTLYSTEVDSVGATDGLGVLYATVELSGSTMVDAKGKYYFDGAPAPAGVAKSLMDGYGLLYWQGDARLVVDSPDASYLSRVVSVDGARPEWASMRGVVQQQVDDVVSGRVTLHLGPPAHLSPQEFVARLQAARGLRAAPAELTAGRRDGGAATSTGGPAEGTPPKLQFGGAKVDLVLVGHYTGAGWASADRGWLLHAEQFREAGGRVLWLPGRGNANGEVRTITNNGFTYRVGYVHRYHGTPYQCPVPDTHLKNYYQEADGTISEEAVTRPGGSC